MNSGRAHQETHLQHGPLRLLCCSGSLEGGGSERQLWQLTRVLDRDRFCPLVYLLYRRGVYLDTLPNDVRVFDYWTQATGRAFLPGQIHRSQVRDLQKVIQDQSIQMVYDRTFHMTLVTSAACQTAQVPRVSVIVSPPSRDFTMSKERFAWIKKRKLRRAYLHPNSTTLAVSAAVADDAAAFYGIERSRIEVVPSPVDVAEVQRLAEVDGLNLGPGRHVCVVGRMSAEKGHKTAIEAMARLVHCASEDCASEHCASQPWTLHLVGDGPDRSVLMQQVEDLHLSGQVVFHGFQANPYPLMAAADIVLIPSRYEGLPNVALEAMALRTPIVATECSPSLVELLSDDRGVVVPVDKAEPMSAAIEQLFGNVQALQARCEVAFRFVAKHFGIQEWKRTMESIFVDRMAEHRRRWPQSMHGDERASK